MSKNTIGAALSCATDGSGSSNRQIHTSLFIAFSSRMGGGNIPGSTRPVVSPCKMFLVLFAQQPFLERGWRHAGFLLEYAVEGRLAVEPRSQGDFEDVSCAGRIGEQALGVIDAIAIDEIEKRPLLGDVDHLRQVMRRQAEAAGEVRQPQLAVQEGLVPLHELQQPLLVVANLVRRERGLLILRP